MDWEHIFHFLTYVAINSVAFTLVLWLASAFKRWIKRDWERRHAEH